jgi:hypothetical protein
MAGGIGYYHYMIGYIGNMPLNMRLIHCHYRENSTFVIYSILFIAISEPDES